MRRQPVDSTALYEPRPLTLSLSPGGGEGARLVRRSSKTGLAWPLVLLASLCLSAEAASTLGARAGFAAYAGSTGCRECHAAFYERWSDSWHGRSLRSWSAAFAQTRFPKPVEDLKVGEVVYQVRVGEREGRVIERSRDGTNDYAIQQVVGGRDVMFFLTPLAGGRLQVLPVAYDVHRKEWFNPASSALRHFPEVAERPIDWRDPVYTFNAACYQCHVSQGTHAYDPRTDAVRSSWFEPGINCETCHGPAHEHEKVCRAATAGSPPTDLRVISTRNFDAEQVNSMCGPCHAKQIPLTERFRPGERFFDHFELTGWEDPDFHPDGRDWGENYTYTRWRSSPCVQGGSLNCLHCHTSNGRYRFTERRANEACLPCHQARVENVSAHSHHLHTSAGSQCVGCHMPRSEFARMIRHDHSMRPPTPAVTLALGSPNACNGCHADRDAAWADSYVRHWYRRDAQAIALRQAELVAAARQQDWRRLDEMLVCLGDPQRDEVAVASLIRLLGNTDDPRTVRAFVGALADHSPLVRSAAARGLYGPLAPETAAALILALRDDYRVVRIAAAAALARLSPAELGAARVDFERAAEEFLSAMQARGEDHLAYHEVGHFRLDRREFKEAIVAFETALRLQPNNLATLISLGTACYRDGQIAAAERHLAQAVEMAPTNAAAHFNLGLLREAQGRRAEAEAAWRRTLEFEPGHAGARTRLAGSRAPSRSR